MGGMAVRDGSFPRDGAVFSIDCGAGRNTLADFTGVIDSRVLSDGTTKWRSRANLAIPCLCRRQLFVVMARRDSRIHLRFTGLRRRANRADNLTEIERRTVGCRDGSRSDDRGGAAHSSNVRPLREALRR
jgi:hypothetical protein